MSFETHETRARVRVALGTLALAALASAATAEPLGITRLLAESARLNPPTFKAVLGLTGATAPRTGLAVETMPDGTLTAALGEAGLHVWIAAIGADGSLHSTCVDDPAAAAAVLAGGVTLEEQ